MKTERKIEMICRVAVICVIIGVVMLGCAFFKFFEGAERFAAGFFCIAVIVEAYITDKHKISQETKSPN